MFDVEKCDCGEYACKDDIIKSEVSGKPICPKCSVCCPNCGRLICEDEVLHTKKCCDCDEDY